MDKALEIKRKKNIHLGLLIFLIILHITHLFLFEMVKIGMVPLGDSFLQMVIGIISIGVTILCIFFLRYFIKRRWLFYTYVFLFLVCIVFQLATLDLNLATDLYTWQHKLLTLAMGISVFIFWSILILAIRDIFVEKHDVNYTLLGAANIFLSLIVTFAYTIGLIFLIDPTLMELGTNINEAYHVCFIISSYSVAGIDFPYPQIPQLVKNITTFQSIIVHLYAVLIVGRLLSR